MSIHCTNYISGQYRTPFKKVVLVHQNGHLKVIYLFFVEMAQGSLEPLPCEGARSAEF